MGKKKTVNGLEKLDEIVKHQKPTHQEDGYAPLPAFEAVETAEERKEREEEQAKALEALQQYKEMQETAIPGYVKELWRCLDGNEEHRYTHSREFKQFSEAIATHVLPMNNRNKIAREWAQTTYVKALVEHCPERRWAILSVLFGPRMESCAILPGLTDLGLLKETESASSKTFSVQVGKELKHFGGNRTLVSAISAKSDAAREAAKEHYQKTTAELHAQSTISIEEMLNGKKGFTALTVKTFKTGNFKIQGGTVLLGADGESISIAGETGQFAYRMQEIREANHMLPVRAACEPDFQKVELGKRLHKQEFTNLRFLHSVIRQSLEADDRAEENRVEKEKFKQQCLDEAKELYEEAELNAREWLFDEAQGTAVLYVPAWSVTRDGTEEKFWHIHMLVERGKNGHVKLVEVAKRVETLFNEEHYEEQEPGTRFSNLTYPLGQLMRAAHGIARKRTPADRVNDAGADEK